MTTWADVDLWKAQRDAVAKGLGELAALSKAEHKELIAREKRWHNLKIRFRELPADLAEAVFRESRKYSRRLKGVSPMSPAAEIAMDWLEANGLGPGKPRRWYPTCPAERAMIDALAGVRMIPASTAKRILRALQANPNRITSAMAHYLRTVVHFYRGQIKPEQLPEYCRWLLNEETGLVE